MDPSNHEAFDSVVNDEMQISKHDALSTADMANLLKANIFPLIKEAAEEGFYSLSVSKIEPHVVEALRSYGYKVDLKCGFNKTETEAVQGYIISWHKKKGSIKMDRTTIEFDADFTDTEATKQLIEKVFSDQHEITIKNLTGIYNCHIAKGKSPKEAFDSVVNAFPCDEEKCEAIFPSTPDYEAKLRAIFTDKDFYRDIYRTFMSMSRQIKKNEANTVRLVTNIRTGREALGNKINDCGYDVLAVAKLYHEVCHAAAYDREITDEQIAEKWNKIISIIQEIGESMRRGGWVPDVGLQFKGGKG